MEGETGRGAVGLAEAGCGKVESCLLDHLTGCYLGKADAFPKAAIDLSQSTLLHSKVAL